MASEKSGRHRVIFATKEDHAQPSTVVLPEAEPKPGLLLPNGEINWTCPCLGGIATGPCGVPFRTALSCFHESRAAPRGSDCTWALRAMQECMLRYPTLYKKTEQDDGTLASAGVPTRIDSDVDEFSLPDRRPSGARGPRGERGPRTHFDYEMNP